ncbi:MAG TPA: HAMP domain-containing sensor histidine kinase [Bryobacteraceae bacterium]|nr:HAMP domain-containing sensor histidine kinase [Bryobacteraceae bacterium]
MRPLTIRLLSVRRSLPLFLAIVVCLAIWQVWLTWRLMEQDRNLAAQHARERLEQIADLAVAQLASALGEWDLSLRELDALPPPASLRTKLPPDGTLVLLAHHSVAVYPGKSLLFVPEPPAAAPLPNGFEAAEKLEFRDQNYDRAIAALQPLTGQLVTRAEAWLRIARLERRLNHPEAALAAYDRMSGETGVSPDGVPYALLAAGARCELRGGAELQRLRAALIEGRWPLHRETFEYYWSEVNRIRHTADDPPKDALEFSSLVSRLHEQWQQALRTGSNSSGREARPDASLLIWYSTPTRLTALSAPAGWLGAGLKLPANSGDIRWRLQPSGLPAGAETHVLRSLAEAQLGGKIEFSSIAAISHGGIGRALWLAGLALMLLLVLAGAYAMYRGVSRELRVAQLQSDFVSAVSHEFRSPLTTLRGITELLANDRLADEGRRRQSYVFLERETGRLQRLVEDLLDFGRMESGRKQYRIAPHDVFGVVRAAVAEFREEALAGGFQVEMEIDARAATIQADEEALRRAIRNLLENAVKYSPECRTVWVEGRLNHRQAAISVRDRGMGIDPREQRQIFQKFVRGAAAKKAGIKGTGIGLSMVRQIVNAHGGEIRLQSASGEGSTFTILLPLSGDGETHA